MARRIVEFIPAAAVGLLLCITAVRAPEAKASEDKAATLTGIWQLVPKETGPKPAIPYTPEYEAIYEHRQKLVDEGKLDIGGLCMPPGMPRMLEYLGQFEILAAPPGRLTILSEYETQIRRIYIDAKPVAKPPVSVNGYSTAHWEGNTLVVMTTAIGEFSFLDKDAGPHSPQLQVTERMTRISPTRMSVEYTVEDPVALTKPWKYTDVFAYTPDAQQIDYECNENPRNLANPDGTLGYQTHGVLDQ